MESYQQFITKSDKTHNHHESHKKASWRSTNILICILYDKLKPLLTCYPSQTSKLLGNPIFS